MNASILKLIELELGARTQLVNEIMSIIHIGWQDGDGHIRREELHNFIYHQLGFKGRCGHTFARFITKVLVENGYREGWSRSKWCYYGLIKLPNQIADQQ